MKLQYKYSLLAYILVGYMSLKNINMETPPIFRMQHADKLIHLLMYVFLAGVCTLEAHHVTSKLKQICLCLLFPIVYGGIIELLQEFYFPPRTGEWADFGFDIIGTFIGWGIVICWIKLTQKHT